MKVYRHFDDIQIKSIKNPVLTVGTFDGVHIGHQKIIEKLKIEAQRIHGETVLFTFFPHPRLVIQPMNNSLKMIQTLEEKIADLERIGLDHLIIMPFTTEFSHIEAEDFIKEYLVGKLGVKTIVVGYDHRFGKERKGDIHLLEKLSGIYAYNVIEISAEEIDEVNVSSTKIRQAILEGDIETANMYLNQKFEMSGIVVRGRQLGRTLGFPTANIKLVDDLKIVPTIGIYIVEVILSNGKSYHGMMSIGKNPTVTSDISIKMEVYLFDFEGDLYGQNLTVQFLKYLRNELKFNSLEELITQMNDDKQTTLDYFVTHRL